MLDFKLWFTLSLQVDKRKTLKEHVGIWVTHIEVIQIGKKQKFFGDITP